VPPELTDNVRLILGTRIGERPMNRNFGTPIRDLLHDPDLQGDCQDSGESPGGEGRQQEVGTHQNGCRHENGQQSSSQEACKKAESLCNPGRRER